MITAESDCYQIVNSSLPATYRRAHGEYDIDSVSAWLSEFNRYFINIMVLPDVDHFFKFNYITPLYPVFHRILDKNTGAECLFGLFFL
jgi:hypothetical protein